MNDGERWAREDMAQWLLSVCSVACLHMRHLGTAHSHPGRGGAPECTKTQQVEYLNGQGLFFGTISCTVSCMGNGIMHVLMQGVSGIQNESILHGGLTTMRVLSCIKMTAWTAVACQTTEGKYHSY